MIFNFIILISILPGFLEGQKPPFRDPLDAMCKAYYLRSEPFYELIKKVKYFLWARRNAGDNNEISLLPFDSASLEFSRFDGFKKTYILIHGYTHFGKTQWILDAKTSILNIEDANVLWVDYGELAKETTKLDYIPAVCNAFTVAKYTASVLNWLNEERKLEGFRIHLIGHSLGAHLAGIIGLYLKHDDNLTIGKATRITGLDPAGPAFGKPYLNKGLRLDKDQADFVDVIHTNGVKFTPGVLSFGMIEKLGHVDFYPNGGEQQPGCGWNNGLCSHLRVLEFYIESMNPNGLTFKSWPCGSWKEFESRKSESCDEGCLEMGFRVTPRLESKKMYCLRTNEFPPYAKGDSQE